MPDRTCTADGCDSPYRAKGLCGTHYNRQRYTKEERHPKVTVACTTCGEPTTTSKRTTARYAGTFCSYHCRDLWRLAHGHRGRPRKPCGLVPLPRDLWAPRTHLPAGHPARQPAPEPPLRWVAGPCAWCGETFVDRQPMARYCSPLCARRQGRRTARHARRARLTSATHTAYTRTEVARTHGTDCHICTYPVDLASPAGLPDSPTLDHVIALATGGSDTLDNVRLAHSYCNAVKGDRPLADVAC